MVTTTTACSGYGGWLPKHPEIYQSFFRNLIRHTLDRAERSTTHEPAVADFEKAIKDDPIMTSLFDQIFQQVDETNKVKNFDHLLSMLDTIVVKAPSYEVATDGNGNELSEPIGVPIYLIFDLLSNTAAGYDLFRMEAFNRALKALLDSWGRFLMQPRSNETLNTTKTGWFGEAGIKALSEYLGQYTFEETFECPDPAADNRGFLTWDAFFTREVQPNARPIKKDHIILKPSRPPHTAEIPLPLATTIYSACESTVFRISRNVKQHDQFWLKGQSYSLYDMLNRDDQYAKLFEGGTVYQAFLGPTDFHRWHSPVKGVIEKVVLIDGSYYAVIPDAGAEPGDPERPVGDPHGALIRSQPFLTIEATRALIYIASDLGMICFIGVGMAEVSTCHVRVRQGDLVEPGTELGMFHFGGSSSAIIFPSGVAFVEDADNGVVVGEHVWVNSVLGVAQRVLPLDA
ncbi:phosphatidylserine decarboxylase [Suillus paluster]|uniref:phosphatidylserine decarboxylase n=1 Tax=Suillus paluster TaxID=48578 RepID=UPI001B87DC41|nr:phosphatidylserine decarboxylase [Suillus paluster]KAG1729956.1 phosphatidylserine decarboxylase [Suillus paluster]